MDDYIYIFQKGFNFSQDGPGNRLVYHLSGCNMLCPWCSNPEGMAKTEKSQKLSINEILNEAISCKMMFIENGGVTFTGGEVSLQADALEKLISLLKENGINTCIETNASLHSLEKLIPLVDYMIADFKSPNEKLLKEVTGANIEIIKENLLKRAKLNKPLLVRVPLINGFNTGEENANGFSEFFKELVNTGNKEIHFEILTYHEFGKEKWQKQGKSYKVENGFVTNEQVEILRNTLTKNDLKIINT